MKGLEKPLNASRIESDTEESIKTQFWPPNKPSSDQQILLDWEPYFRYYKDQCQVALVGRGRSVMAKTHQDILDLIHLFEKGSTRGDIKMRLKDKLNAPVRVDEDEITDGAIDLAARLYLMINIAVDHRLVSGYERIQWKNGNLEGCLGAHFSEPQTLSDSGLRLEPTLTAANLENIAGIQIKPTDNLVDHLRLMDVDGGTALAVFCHVSFLRRNASTVLPNGLAAETLQTLSLLFPIGDRPTKQWLRRHIDTKGLDVELSKCSPLKLENRQFEKFKFWHDRLIMLKQSFDESRPSTISQWWFDRRNGVQWYTFWVAIVVLFLTMFFGLVQSIEGALQVYKAFYPAN